MCVCVLFMAFCLGFITTPDYKKRVMGEKKFCLNLNSDFFFFSPNCCSTNTHWAITLQHPLCCKHVSFWQYALWKNSFQRPANYNYVNRNIAYFGSQLIRMQIILFFIVRRGEEVTTVIHKIQSWLTAPSHTKVFCQGYNVCGSFIS